MRDLYSNTSTITLYPANSNRRFDVECDAYEHIYQHMNPLATRSHIDSFAEDWIEQCWNVASVQIATFARKLYRAMYRGEQRLALAQMKHSAMHRISKARRFGGPRVYTALPQSARYDREQHRITFEVKKMGDHYGVLIKCILFDRLVECGSKSSAEHWRDIAIRELDYCGGVRLAICYRGAMKYIRTDIYEKCYPLADSIYRATLHYGVQAVILALQSIQFQGCESR